MKVQILEDVAISPREMGGERWACAFSVSCRLANGDIVCVYRRGKDKHSRDGILLGQRSTDGGRTWSAPLSIHDGMSLAVPESVHAGAVCQLADGTVLAMLTVVYAKDPEAYIFSETGRRLEQRFLVAESRDNGRTWGPARPATLPETPPLRYINMRPLALPDGDLLMAIEVTPESKRQGVMIGRYSGAGGTFTPFVTRTVDPAGRLDFGDPKLVRLSDGRILMWLWTWVNATEETVEAHTCDSTDEGRTWTAPRPCGIVCQNSALLRLPDDRLLLTANVRVPPEGIRLWSTDSSARGWNPREVIQLWDARKQRPVGSMLSPLELSGRDPSDGRLWESLPGFTFGTPDLVPSNDGAVLLTYYAVNDGFAEVRACRFAVE